MNGETTLDEAWAEAEKVLRSGWELTVSGTMAGGVGIESYEPERYGPARVWGADPYPKRVTYVTALTFAAALLALRDRLQDQP